MYEDYCLLQYLNMSTYEYYTDAAGAAIPIELYHTIPPWSSRASSPVSHALAVELNRPTVTVDCHGVFVYFAPWHLFCSCVAFLSFRSLYPRLYLTT